MARILIAVIIFLLVVPAHLPAAAPQHHRGTVVSAAAKKIVIKEESGKEQSFDVEGMARITLNGKPGRLEDFQATMPVLVTTDEKGVVLAVATIDMRKGSPSKE